MRTKRFFSLLLAAWMLASSGCTTAPVPPAESGTSDDTTAPPAEETTASKEETTAADTEDTAAPEAEIPAPPAPDLPKKEHPDPAVTRPLRYNIGGDGAEKTEPDKPRAVLDVMDERYQKLRNYDIRRTADATMTWTFGVNSGWSIPLTGDLTAYEGYTLSLYAEEEAVGETFLIYFSSENAATDGIDYYSKLITVQEAGWNYYSGMLSSLSVNRTPLGWDKITGLTLTSAGWNQTNKTTTVLWLDNLWLHTNMDGLNTGTLLLGDAAAFSLGGPRAYCNDRIVEISFLDDTSTVFEENGTYWLPLSVFAAVRDPESAYNAASRVLTVALDGVKYTFTGEKNTVSIGGKDEPLGFTVRVRGDSLFVPHTYAMELFGYSELYTDPMGLIILSNQPDIFPADGELDRRLQLCYDTLFTRPTGDEIVKDMYDSLGGDVHPRVMLKKDDFDRLRSYYRTDETFKKWVETLEERFGPYSVQYMDAPVTWALTDGVRLLAISREAKDRMIPWCLLYQITGNEAYVKRVWQEVRALCSFQDWHPSHFLDTAEILYPMAIAYDWLYDQWTPEQRKIMEQATLKMGLTPGLDRYEGRASKWGTNNWNGVCNGGLLSAAVAYATALPDICTKILGYAVKDVENGMFTYAPDGGYLESPGYWSYGTDYLHVLMSTLDSACGTNYGLYNSPGFAESAYFTSYFETEIGSWGFHDSSTGVSDTNVLSWFAAKSGDPALNRLRRNSIDNKIKSLNMYDVMWYDPDNISDTVQLNLDAYYTQLGAVTMRDTWENGALFTGLHGGDNSVPHGDLDIGNFFLDAGGQRFFTEFGSENYNIPGYWGTQRWSYYRKRAEGQNTLIIGDVSYKTPDQTVKAVSSFRRVENNAASSLAIVDMTPAYPSVRDGQRGMLLRDNRSTLILQDEIHLSTPEIVRWIAHTKGNIVISSDGRTAFINQGELFLCCEIVSDDASLVFSEGTAVSLDPAYPVTEGENKRDGVKKLMIVTPDKVTDFEAAVVFKVLYPGDTAPIPGETYTWTDIADWKLD